LKSHLQTFEKGEQSLRLLQRYAQELGDTSDVTSVLRELQTFRSKGGVAHLGRSQMKKAEAALGISGLSNLEAFESVTVRLTACLTRLTDLMSEALRMEETQPETPGSEIGE
jgi:hypothetical protein